MSSSKQILRLLTLFFCFSINDLSMAVTTSLLETNIYRTAIVKDSKKHEALFILSASASEAPIVWMTRNKNAIKQASEITSLRDIKGLRYIGDLSQLIEGGLKKFEIRESRLKASEEILNLKSQHLSKDDFLIRDQDDLMTLGFSIALLGGMGFVLGGVYGAVLVPAVLFGGVLLVHWMDKQDTNETYRKLSILNILNRLKNAPEHIKNIQLKQKYLPVVPHVLRYTKKIPVGA